MTDKEPQGYLDKLREYRDLAKAKRFLKAENAKLRDRIDELQRESESITISISSTEAYLASYEKKRRSCLRDLRKFSAKRETLIREIDQLHLKIKVAQQDEEVSARLIETLKDELRDIKSRKEILIRKLDDIQSGIQNIFNARKLRIPRLRTYDSALKDLHKTLLETQNRMDISLMLRQK